VRDVDGLSLIIISYFSKTPAEFEFLFDVDCAVKVTLIGTTAK